MEEFTMTSFEKAEIRRLPKKYRPMGAWGYFWHSVLYSIPVIGWICLIWGACNDKKISRRSYARSYFCAFIIVLVLCLIVGVLVGMELISTDMLTEAMEKMGASSDI